METKRDAVNRISREWVTFCKANSHHISPSAAFSADSTALGRGVAPLSANAYPNSLVLPTACRVLAEIREVAVLDWGAWRFKLATEFPIAGNAMHLVLCEAGLLPPLDQLGKEIIGHCLHLDL